MLYVSDAATVALNSTLPSMDSQRPSRVCTLFAMATWCVQIRVTGSGVAVGERGRDQAGHIDLPDPVPSLPGEQCVAFEPESRPPLSAVSRPTPDA